MVLTELQKSYFYPGLKWAFLSIAAIAIATFLGPLMPWYLLNVAQAASIAGEVYLIGIGYGIVNDIFATGQSIDYFSKGHNWGFRAIESEDRLANSFVWGIVATRALSFIAAIPFGISALICNFFALPALSVFLPGMIVGAGIIIIAADIFARVKKHNRLKEGTVEERFQESQWGLQPSQTGNVKTLEQKAGWLSCNDRNAFGYLTMPLLGILGLIAYTTLRIVPVALPVIALSVPLQIGLIALPFVVLTAGIGYVFSHNPKKQLPVFPVPAPADEEKKTNLNELTRNPSPSPRPSFTKRKDLAFVFPRSKSIGAMPSCAEPDFLHGEHKETMQISPIIKTDLARDTAKTNKEKSALREHSVLSAISKKTLSRSQSCDSFFPKLVRP